MRMTMGPTMRTPARAAVRPAMRRTMRRGEFSTRLEFALAAVIVMLLFLAVLVALTPRPAWGQLAPEAPRLLSPHGSGGLGTHWVNDRADPSSGGALVVTWAMPALPRGMRLRAGAGQGVAGKSSVLGGVDYQVPLVRGAPRTWTLDLDWQSGLGLSAGEYSVLTLPTGLVGSASWRAGAVWLAPFAGAGVAADLRLGDDSPEKEFRVDPAFEVGVDLAFDERRRVVLRAAQGFGARRALAVGASFSAWGAP